MSATPKANKVKQKFKRGDLVHVCKDLGPHMAHFVNDVDAVVIGSYFNLYHNMCHSDAHSRQTYSLVLLGGPVFARIEQPYACSWYDEEQLTLLSKGWFNKIQQELGE